MSLHERYKSIQQRIISAKARRTTIAPGKVCLLAVSKRHSADAISALYAAGQRDFGENYLQEALAKMSALTNLKISWHFIGALQANKTRRIAENFSWVHSVDRIKVAERLNAARPEDKLPLNVCIEVNISNAPRKSGVSAHVAMPLAAAVARLPRLSLRGLMVLPELAENPERQNDTFAKIYQLYRELQKNNAAKFDTLSMGTSVDMEPAIIHGSTMVRIGSALFGPRVAPLEQH